MEDLAVEVYGENGALYKGFIQDIFEDSVLIHFEDGWQPDSKFPYSQVRLPPKPDTKTDITEFTENMEVEVYSRANQQEAYGWWKSRIKELKKKRGTAHSATNEGLIKDHHMSKVDLKAWIKKFGLSHFN